MNLVAHKIRETQTFRMARIRTTREIFSALDAVTGGGRTKLETLDFYDHAGEGIQRLGVSHIFSRGPSGLVGGSLLAKFDTYLSGTAAIRLLGCFVGSAQNGSWLIEALQAVAARKRRVYGTRIRMDHKAFGRRGLKAHYAKYNLYTPP
jgi:hypothetical protein